MAAPYSAWNGHEDAQHGLAAPPSVHDPFLSHPSTPMTGIGTMHFDPYAEPASPREHTPFRDEASSFYRTSAAAASNADVGLLDASPGYPPYRDSPGGSQPSFKQSSSEEYGALPTLGDQYHEKPRKPIRGRGLTWCLVLGAIVLVAGAVMVAVYFTVIKGKGDTKAGGNSTSAGGGSSASALTTGGDGSTVTTSNGSTFTYANCAFFRSVVSTALC